MSRMDGQTAEWMDSEMNGLTEGWMDRAEWMD